MKTAQASQDASTTAHENSWRDATACAQSNLPDSLQRDRKLRFAAGYGNAQYHGIGRDAHDFALETLAVLGHQLDVAADQAGQTFLGDKHEFLVGGRRWRQAFDDPGFHTRARVESFGGGGALAMILRSPCAFARSGVALMSAAIVGGGEVAGSCTLAGAAGAAVVVLVAGSSFLAGAAEVPASPPTPVSASGAVPAGAGMVTTATGGSTTVVMSTGRSGVANARRSMIGGASS